MERDASEVFEYILQVEELAEEVLADKQQIIDLDRKRQQTRQATRILHKSNPQDKSWICFGNMFLKMTNQKAAKFLEKDFDELDESINDTRTKLKQKVNKLRDAEHKEEIKGFSLQPLTREELSAVSSVL